jgi:hypothetical protein
MSRCAKSRRVVQEFDFGVVLRNGADHLNISVMYALLAIYCSCILSLCPVTPADCRGEAGKTEGVIVLLSLAKSCGRLLRSSQRVNTYVVNKNSIMMQG